MSIADRELWACALAIERRYGERAPVHVAERIGTLVLEDNRDGVEVWKAIAARLDRLRRQRPD